MALLSIIIPFYNKGDYIDRCLQSIDGQNFRDFEIIIVDDGSLIPLIKGKFNVQDQDKIEIYRIENSGPGFARNFGASKSDSEFLLFLDADDYLAPNSLDVFFKDYHCHPHYDCFLYGFKYLSQPFPKVPFLECESSSQENFTKIPLTESHLPFIVNFFAAGCVIIKRKLFLNTGGYFDKFNARFGEDAYMWIQVVLSGCTIFRSSYCFVDIDDSVSELGIGLRKNKPVPVFLMCEKILRKRINPEKIKLFDSWIHFHLDITIARLMNEGRIKELRDLVIKYPGIVFQKKHITYSLKKIIKRYLS